MTAHVLKSQVQRKEFAMTYLERWEPLAVLDMLELAELAAQEEAEEDSE